MKRRYRDFSDYHASAPGLVLRSRDWGCANVRLVNETSNDVVFRSTETMALCLELSGTERHLTEMDGLRDARPTRPGDVCAIPAGIEARFAWRTLGASQQGVMVQFDGTLFSTFAPEVKTDAFACGHLRPANYAPHPTLAALIEMLAREADPVHRRGSAFADSVLRLLALEVASGCWTAPAGGRVRQTAPRTCLTRAQDFIEANLAEDISLRDIAAAAGVSLGNLIATFRRQTGRTPYAFVIDRRVRRAAELLRMTEMPLTHVAMECGFADQAHMSRQVRARLGTTPLAIRNNPD